jgi:hypothetical protein
MFHISSYLICSSLQNTATNKQTNKQIELNYEGKSKSKGTFIVNIQKRN